MCFEIGEFFLDFVYILFKSFKLMFSTADYFDRCLYAQKMNLVDTDHL
jgi:hypothetical protein